MLIFEGCSEDYLYLFPFSILDTFILVHGSCDHYWHTLYISSLYVDVCFFHLPLYVLFLFSLYAHASYYLYAIYYFCFTQICLDEFCLKCFRNTSCQSLLAINSLLAKFSRVCVKIDFIVFNKWIWVEWFMTFLICSFVFCGFVMSCQRGRLLGYMWFTC